MATRRGNKPDASPRLAPFCITSDSHSLRPYTPETTTSVKTRLGVRMEE
jgi:hypothetical protein